MKGREFYSLESLSNEDASRFQLDEVYVDFRKSIFVEGLGYRRCSA